MLGEYCTTDAIWKHVTGTNKYNEPEYVESTIKVRKEDIIKLVRNKQGVEVVSSTTVFTETTVTAGDLIDDRMVIAISSSKDLDGNTDGYEVMLE